MVRNRRELAAPSAAEQKCGKPHPLLSIPCPSQWGGGWRRPLAGVSSVSRARPAGMAGRVNARTT
jgi:hypothetical protein